MKIRNAKLEMLAKLISNTKFDLLKAGGFLLIKHIPVWSFPIVVANVISIAGSNVQDRGLRLLENAVFVIFVFSINLPCNRQYTRYLSDASRGIESTIRKDLLTAIHRLPISTFSDNNIGTLQDRLVSDTNTIQQLIYQLFESGVSSLASISIGIAVISKKEPVFLGYFIGIVLLSTLIAVVARSRIGYTSSQYAEHCRDFSASISTALLLMPYVLAHGLEQGQITKIVKQIDEGVGIGTKLDSKTSFLGAIAWLSLQACYFLCIFALCYVIIISKASDKIGDLVLMAAYFGILTGAILSLYSLTNLWERGMRALGEIIDLKAKSLAISHDSGTKLKSFHADIRFDGVSLHFPDRDNTVIEDVSFHIRPGEFVSIVGSSGAGKSTISRLLVGLVPPTNGQIYYDGHNLSDLNLLSLRKSISLIPQQPYLFNASIAENIRFGCPTATTRELELALTLSEAHEFVFRLPNRLETRIGENGVLLSRGQQQRIMIAIAILRKPQLLLMDEVTSSLDDEIAARVKHSIRDFARNCTTIAFSHAIDDALKADRLFLIENQKVKEIRC